MITYLETARQFQLDTPHASYVLAVADEGYLCHVYWGKRLAPQDMTDLLRLRENPFVPSQNNRERASFMDCAPFEYPCGGTGDYRESAFVIETVSGARACDLRYVSHRIYNGKHAPHGLPHTWGNGCETLEITLRDEPTGTEVRLHYTIFDGIDAVIRSASLAGCGENLTLLRALSASLDIDDDRFEMLSLYGSWARERQAERLPLRHGKQRLDSLRGESSHQYSPFFALVRPETTEQTGEAYGISLIYSGNFLAQAELTQFCQTRVQIGIHPENFAWKLSPDCCIFDTPEAVLTYSGEGIGGMSRVFHRLFAEHLIRSPYRFKERPVLINNWEATYFDFSLGKLKTIADEAAQLGIDLFVLDDGWFGHRDSDNCSLGDWTPDERKLPGGLQPLTDHLAEKGMRFGLWFEPEMISPDSDLFRANPDFAIGIEGRARTQSRAQYVLDFTRGDVRDAVWRQMKQILSTVPVSYIKWDMNRQLTEEPYPGFAHSYMLGVYQLLERLVSEYPDILPESCSGGGARFDPGMLYYSPQIWASDNTDAKERLRIQYGASLFMPPSAVGAHVSVCPNHATGRSTPFDTRANVAMFGTFGYELDVTALPAEEKAQIPEQIARYRSISHLVREGQLWRLGNPFAPSGYAAQSGADFDAWIFVSQDKTEAVFTYVQITAEANMKSRRIRLAGLCPESVYRFTLDGTEQTKTGAYLMQCGVLIRNLWGDMTSLQCVLRREK